jgi:hypothetical protein
LGLHRLVTSQRLYSSSGPIPFFEAPAGASGNACRVNGVCSTKFYSRVDWKMNETHQLASAMLAIAFAAVMLVAGQLFIEYRTNKYPVAQAVQTASRPL